MGRPRVSAPPRAQKSAPRASNAPHAGQHATHGSPGAPHPTTTALGVSTLTERLRAAATRHDSLVTRVSRRRSVRDALVVDTRTAVTHVVMRMQTLIDEGRRIEREIHGLMQALVDDPDRSRRQRAELDAIYLELEQDVITPREQLRPPGSPWDDDGADDEHGPGPRGPGGRGPGAWGPSDEPADHEFTPSKPKPSDRGTLRALFRRLAEALHPDKVQDEAERARRTEIMKQVTVAYGEGDYARLVEIELAWAGEAGFLDLDPDTDADEVERRLAVKERAIAELEAQLATIEREIRRLRASHDGKLAREYQRHGGADGRTPVEANADDELARLREVRDFIVAFRDGKIDFARFVRGPAGGAGHRADPYAAAHDLELDVDLGGGLDADMARMLEELIDLAHDGGIDPRDILRAVQAAAHGAGPGPRRSPPRRRR